MKVENCAYCGKKFDGEIYLNTIIFCSPECSDKSHEIDSIETLRKKALAHDHLEIMWRENMKAWVAVACSDKAKPFLDVVEETWFSFSGARSCSCGKCCQNEE